MNPKKSEDPKGRNRIPPPPTYPPPPPPPFRRRPLPPPPYQSRPPSTPPPALPPSYEPIQPTILPLPQGSGGGTSTGVRPKVKGYDMGRRAVSAEDLTILSRQQMLTGLMADTSTTQAPAQVGRHRHRAGDGGASARVRRMSEPTQPTTSISPLINKYRDQRTGEPDFDAMRRDLPRDPNTGELIQLPASLLARRNRSLVIKEHLALADEKKKMTVLLDNLPMNDYDRVATELGDRYIRRFPSVSGQRLQPSSRFTDDKDNERVNRRLTSMGSSLVPNTYERKIYDKIKPVGRMGTRATPVSAEDTAQVERMKQLIGKDFTQRDLDLIEYLKKTYKEDRELHDAYIYYRDQTNPDSKGNAPLRSRMIPRPGSDYSRREDDTRRVRKIYTKRIREARGAGEREERIAREHAKRKKAATIPSTHMPVDLRGVPVIAEEEEPEEESDSE